MREATPQRPALRLAVVAWCVLVVAAGQLPFIHVWLGQSFFFYDAFTTFAPILTLLVSQFLSGVGMLNLDQELIPTQVAGTYAFTNLLRQLTVVLAPSGPHGHSLVQALHIVLSQVGAAFLFRTLGVPMRYGLVGGLVFILSGIHVSLTQHLAASEALFYLVMSLAMLRLFIQRAPRAQRPVAAFLWSGATLFLICLVRGHHEAVLYFLPVTGWALWHAGLEWGRIDRPARVRLAIGFGLMAAAVVVASAPMLITTLEVAEFNKTLMADLGELGSYFPDWRSFGMGLLLPRSTGPLTHTAFALGHDPTLSYIFLGTLTVPLTAVYVADRWRHGAMRQALTAVACIVLLAGFAFGGKSPVYQAMLWLFPPFAQIGHSWFALHLLYLVAGFAVSAGLSLIARKLPVRDFAMAGMATIVLVLALLASVWYGPAVGGLTGSREVFRATLRWEFLFMAAAMAIVVAGMVGTAWWRKRSPDAGVRTKHAVVPAASLCAALVALVVVLDMLRPIRGAHFLPLPMHAEWASSENGGFTPSKPILEYLARHSSVRPPFRSVRVLPIYPKPGGWQANSLWTVGVAMTSTPGDSGGNRYLEKELSTPPTPDRLRWLAEKYGLDYFWIARWGRDEWAKAARESAFLRVVASDPWGGDLFRFDPVAVGTPEVVVEGRTLEIGWFVTQSLAEREVGLLGTTRHFRIPARPEHARDGQPVDRVVLPVMWKKYFRVQDQDGAVLPHARDELGRLEVAVGGRSPSEIVLRYPAPALQLAVLLAAVLYFAILATVSASGLAIVFARVRRGRAQAVAAPGGSAVDDAAAQGSRVS